MPRQIGPMLRAQSLLGRRIRDATNRALGADTAFLDVDQSARSQYDERIA